jgi:hypothetical protein
LKVCTDPGDAAWSKGELVLVPSVFGRLRADLLLAPVPSMAEVKDRYGRPERGGSEWEPIKILPFG